MKASALVAALSAALLLACGGEDGATPTDTGAVAPADVAGDSEGPLSDNGGAPEAAALEEVFADAGGPPSCGSCHGEPESPSPPPSVSGETDFTAPGVGAHAAHLGPSDWHAEVQCKHCHPMPAEVDAPGHIDEQRPADVAFKGLAVYAVSTPKYEGGSCAVYCHGSAMAVAPANSPTWTSGAKADCTTCHAMPPAKPHPNDSGCGRCHVELLAEDGKTFVKPAFHMDSILQAPHGAHIVHLGGGEGGVALECDVCHDGTNYHGALKDGKGYEETAVCGPCHGQKPSQQQWVEYQALAK